MPIENEKKYVIIETPAVEEMIAEVAEQTLHIEQKYLTLEKGLSVRVRSIVHDGVYSYRLTVKKDVGGQCVEIETPISEDDFTKLWPTGYNKVSKIRYVYQGWEIDFFKCPTGKNYLAIAEIEMEPWEKAPQKIPELIANHIIYIVPLNDSRFSNKKIGNMKYAKSLLETVKKISKSPHLTEVKSSVKAFKKEKIK